MDLETFIHMGKGVLGFAFVLTPLLLYIEKRSAKDHERIFKQEQQKQINSLNHHLTKQ